MSAPGPQRKPTNPIDVLGSVVRITPCDGGVTVSSGTTHGRGRLTQALRTPKDRKAHVHMPRLASVVRSTLTPPPPGLLHARRVPLQLSLFDLPVLCCSCFRMQTANGKWTRYPVRASDYPKVEFSHGICSPCLKRLYPDLFKSRASG
jgi:hypothetical protein